MSRQVWFSLLFSLSVLFTLSVDAGAQTYPRDGRFKKLSSDQDPWYFIDHKKWYIKAPDKWTHFMGSYALAEVFHGITKDKVWGGVIAIGLGILKEYDDAYREGWSPRDLTVDIGGVAASTLLPDDLKLLAYYDDTAIIFKLSILIP